jgi:cell division transport system permease protein
MSRPGPIFPPEAAPLKTLTAAMAIMCYLACLAIGGLILINRAVEAWTAGLQSEVTVQIKQISQANIDEEIAKAESLLRRTAGVISVTTLDRQAGARLLEPWLGPIRAIDELPIPRLIRVGVDAATPPDFDALNAGLAREVKGASLDTHQRWQAELTRMAGVLEYLSYAILALIAISAVAIVVFATRTVVDANREVVDVLHLVGARDGFIARQMQGRFLKTGLLAGCTGLLAGLFTFFLLGLGAAGSSAGGIAEASRSLLFAPLGISWASHLLLLAVPLVATLISVLTAKTTLSRILRDQW